MKSQKTDRAFYFDPHFFIPVGIILLLIFGGIGYFLGQWFSNNNKFNPKNWPECDYVPCPSKINTLLEQATKEACVQDEDCILVNKEREPDCCYINGCEPIDYSLDKYIAVNANWRDQQIQASCKQDIGCPNCDPKPINDQYQAVCKNNRCEKVSFEEDRIIIPPSGNSCCTKEQLDAGFRCIQGCEPPVARENDLIPGYFCTDPETVLSRSKFGCPICLSSSTNISTPKGEINIKKLKVGDAVWSVDKYKRKVAVPIVKTSSVQVQVNHQMVNLNLVDGRKLLVSPGHPTIEGKSVGELKKGDMYAGSVIISHSLEVYTDTKTYDILPGGDTGFYFANGILLGSTLK